MCLKPLYKFLKGPFYNERAFREDFEDKNAIFIKCGKCHECLINKNYLIFNKWNMELEELLKLKDNYYAYFITLTYDNENYEELKTKFYLTKLQNLFKNLRRKFKFNYFKYLVSTELGAKTFRLHHHMILIVDKDFLKINKNQKGRWLNGFWYYNSENLGWNFGFHTIAKVIINDLKNDDTNLSFKKTLKYILKYSLKSPLKLLMSKNVGRSWIEKNTDLKKGIYFWNGRQYNSPYIKKLRKNEEIIEDNYLFNSTKKMSKFKMNLETSKVKKLWN